jgi:hypothetical protein
MASKSRALLLSLPPLARRLRQMGVATVIAASLLLLAAEARAQAPLVTIQTRVVTNNSPNPYSTLVGTATYGAKGAGPGYHVVALNRTMLTFVLNNTYGLDFKSLNSMNNDIAGLGNNVLVVISSMDPATSFSSQGASFLNGVAANLGGTGQGYLYGGGPVSPSAYSLIGVPGLGDAGGSANQVSTYADPDTNGNIGGVLIPDVNGNYTFTYSQFVEVQTITPPGDTITIGPFTYDGYGSCPLTVERGKIVFAEFGYGGKLLPTFPKWLIDGTRPQRLPWLLKVRVLPPVYWKAMLNGREWLARPSIVPAIAAPRKSS